MKFSEYTAKNIVLADGAMGSYFYEKSNNALPFCELGNINLPHIVRLIHEEYINAGSNLIATNTFAANRFSLDCSKEKVKEIIKSGLDLARSAAGSRDIFIASDIGPIPEVKSDTMLEKDAVLDEYISIIDTFIEEGSDIFLFETFGSFDYLIELSSYIKSKKKDAFVLTSFAVQPDGYLREGAKVQQMLESIKNCSTIDSFGLNCGCGPAHLLKIASRLNTNGWACSFMPNAGYPEVINNRMVYNNAPEYFASKVSKAVSLGFKIVGGCCGTTPEHIRKLKIYLEQGLMTKEEPKPVYVQKSEINTAVYNSFKHKLNSGKLVIACEVDPPFDTNVQKGIEAARYLKESGVDLVTVADSPMARPRMDSIAFAAKIRREVGIETMPHIACRDRNINSLKSSLLGAHMEGIRNILAVTGDGIPEGDRAYVKAVFNLNSVKLIEMIANLNESVFDGDALYIAGAANLNVPNKDVEASRMIKKSNMGASFFLTQPIFCEETIQYVKTLKNKLPKEAKILAGIMPLVSYKNALFLANEMPGITIPKEYISLFSPDMSRDKAQETGIEIALDIIKNILGYVDGLYFMPPFNRVELVSEILNRMNHK